MLSFLDDNISVPQNKPTTNRASLSTLVCAPTLVSSAGWRPHRSHHRLVCQQCSPDCWHTSLATTLARVLVWCASSAGRRGALTFFLSCTAGTPHQNACQALLLWFLWFVACAVVCVGAGWSLGAQKRLPRARLWTRRALLSGVGAGPGVRRRANFQACWKP